MMPTNIKSNMAISAATIFVFIAFIMAIPTAATLERLQVGMDAPDFSLPSFSGETRTFADLNRDKLTIVVFWSSWSANSGKALARIETLYQKYKDQGLSVVGINVERQNITEAILADIKAMSADLKLTFPILIDHGLNTFHDYGVIAVPTTVILDKDRIIKYELSSYPLVGSEEMVDFIVATMEGKDLSAAITEKTGYHPNKKSVRLWNMGNNSLKSRRMADTAGTWFQKAIEADPKFVLPYISLGKFHRDRDQVAQAKEQFEQAVSLEPENAIALCELGMLLVNHDGKIEQGKSFIERALKAEEGYTPCYYFLGFAYGKEGKQEEAFKWFDKAIEVNPTDYKTHIYKARLYEENKNLEQAVQSYKKALELILE